MLYVRAASQMRLWYPSGYTSGSVDSVFGKRSANEMRRLYCAPRYEISAAERLGGRVPDQSIQNAASSHKRKKMSSSTGSADESISLRSGCRRPATSSSMRFTAEFCSAEQDAAVFLLKSLPSFSADRCP